MELKVKRRAATAALALFTSVGVMSCQAWADSGSQAAPQAAQAASTVHVNEFGITGRTGVPADELLALLADAKGKDLTLAQLGDLARKVTDYLRAKGYLVARAYVPAQNLDGGKVEIAVVLGEYDRIMFNNSTRLTDKALAGQLGPVQAGAAIQGDALERAVWLVGDLPGMDAHAALAPGSKPGTSALTVDAVRSGHLFTLSTFADNYGAVGTGYYDVGAGLTANSPFRSGDLITLRGTTSGPGLSTEMLAVSLPAFGQGSRLGVTYSNMSYALQGSDFAPTGLDGSAQIAGAVWDYSLFRSKTKDIRAQAGYESKVMVDDKELDGLPTLTMSSRAAKSYYGTLLGHIGQGDVTADYAVTAKYGTLYVYDSVTAMQDALFAKTAGGFSKVSGSASITWNLSRGMVLDISAQGQGASRNLDSSEKFSIGGANGVRAFPQGEASGDAGALAKADLMIPLLHPAGGKAVLASDVFFDAGNVALNAKPWDVLSDNTRTLMGAGLGLQFSTGWLVASVDYAWKLGNEAVTADADAPGRLWFRLSTTF